MFKAKRPPNEANMIDFLQLQYLYLYILIYFFHHIVKQARQPSKTIQENPILTSENPPNF